MNLELLNNFIIKNYPRFIILAVGLIMASALFMQFALGFEPCKLCKLQRVPYYMIIALGGFYLIGKEKCQKSFTVITIILLFVTALIAFYHAGIEYGVFENIFNCSAGKDQFANLSELKNYLNNKISTPCEKPLFKFILTLSGWNFFISFTLGILGIIHILKLNKS